VHNEAELLHRQSSRHRPAVEQSRICGCFHCQEFFPPAQITRWIQEPARGKQPVAETAVCPKCGVDAVLPERNGVYPMGAQMLRLMHHRWFGEGMSKV